MTRLRSARLLLAVLAATGAAACGSSQLVSPVPTTATGASAPIGSPSATSSSDETTPKRSQLPPPALATPTTPPSAPTTPTTTGRRITLRALVPSGAVLGDAWEDDGDQPTSLDLTDPPAACAPFLAVVHSRRETLVHEFSFGVSPDGTLEQGHYNFAAMRAPSAATVALELAAVATPAFANCAEANAVRWFGDTQSGVTIDRVSARRIDLPVPGAHVVWRVTIENHSARGPSHPMYMDVVHVGGDDVLVKVRIWSCGCTPPASSDGELLPGELGALQVTGRGLGSPVVTD